MDSWIIVPFIDLVEMTQQAVRDCLAQTDCQPRVLLIDQGSGKAASDQMRAWVDQMTKGQESRPKVLLWTFSPPLPSLSAVWNRALDFVWELGGSEALVVNPDVRLHPALYQALVQVLHGEQALFVSAVGVTEADWQACGDPSVGWKATDRGGPDFSCFAISKDCHDSFKFDEGHIPAYCEDLTFHRELLLAGEGQRIFSINFPYLHYASRTLNDAAPETVSRIQKQLGVSRAHYERVWGGPVNRERYAVKGDPTSAREGVTTPELQRRALAPLGGGEVRDGTCSATEGSSGPG